MSKKTGTGEWAVNNVNIAFGCRHDCRYCYARAIALRFQRISTPRKWGSTYCKVRMDEVSKRRRKLKGTVMFPSTHDITPDILPECIEVLRKLVEAGNRVLIVSKPHGACIAAIRMRMYKYRKQMLFRFTIGACDNALLAYWEPGAPNFEERLATLRQTYRDGFATSVSIEPMLDSKNVLELIDRLEPFVTETIWIGKMRDVRRRCVPGTREAAIRRIEAGQTDKRIMEIYRALKDAPKVRWKDSIREVVKKARRK